MTNPYCEVIGCPRPAHWRHSVQNASEEFLCNHHLGILHVCASSKALLYVPLNFDSGEAANREALIALACEEDTSPQSTTIF